MHTYAHGMTWHIFLCTYITLHYVTLHYMHTYIQTCMHAYMHAVQAYMHTYVHAYMHPCIHASMHARCREFPGTMFRNCAGKFKHMRPKIRESTSVFSRGWPEIEKLRRHVREHLPSSPHSMAMHSRCHLNAYGHLYLSASTPHPGRSQAKPNHAANSPRKVTMHFYAPANCIWQHVLK